MRTSARVVREKFQTLIDAQAKLIESLEAEQLATVRAANEERTPVVTAITALAQKTITGPDAPLAKFNVPKTDDDQGFDAPAMWQRLSQDSAAARQEYQDLKQFDRGQDQAIAIAERNITLGVASDAEREGNRLFRVVEPLIEMNRQLERDGKPLISAKTINDYEGGKLLRFITDSSYREVWAALKEYERRSAFPYSSNSSGDPVEDMKDYHAYRAAQKAAEMQAEKDQKWVEAAGARARILDDRAIAGKVQAAVIERAVDAGYVETLAAAFPESKLGQTLPNAVKAQALDAVATSLGQQITTAETTKGQLEEPMSKLRRAGSRSVPVDVDDIACKVSGQSALSQMSIQNASRVRESVRSHQFTDTSSATNMYLLMTVAILASSDNDRYFTAQQLNASDTALDKAGLDLGTLAPDTSKFDVALGDLGIDTKDFNLAGVGIAVGSLHVDIDTGGISSGIGSIDTGPITVSMPSDPGSSMGGY